MTFTEKFRVIQRMDYLIKRKSTGPPESFQRKLGLSKPTFYRFIETIKDLGCEVDYCKGRETYLYRAGVHGVFETKSTLP
jgi:hypothetical protein